MPVALRNIIESRLKEVESWSMASLTIITVSLLTKLKKKHYYNASENMFCQLYSMLLIHCVLLQKHTIWKKEYMQSHKSLKPIFLQTQ